MLVYETQERRRDVNGAQVPAMVRIPIVVVTGYLGSGKTTLVAALMQGGDMSGTAVIVNELADVGIDQSVIGDSGAIDVVLLSNGCLCCARGTDLANTVRRLIDFERPGRPPIDRILIETSGAADPAPIMRQVCFDPLLRSKLRYGGVLCLFDAAFGAGLLERDPVGFRQIALADMVLITKTDLADAASVARHGQRLRLLNAVAAITSDAGEAARFLAGDNRLVGSAGSFAWLGSIAEDATAAHSAEIGTWTIRTDTAIDWPLAEQALRVTFDRYGQSVLRTKGLVWTQGDPRPLVIHGINRHFHRPLRLKAWEAAPQSRIVVIGFPDTEHAAREIAQALAGSVSAGAGRAR